MTNETIFPRKLLGDCRQSMQSIADASVHCTITSVPYWGLRSYLPKDHPLKSLEIGTEETFDLYLDHLSEVFRHVHRVSRDEATLWLNCGDAYSNDTKWGGKSGGKNSTSADGGYCGQRIRRGKDIDPKRVVDGAGVPFTRAFSGLKPKDLMMMPSRVAMRLQSDGWFLRAMIPWIKKNAMPESVRDRPTSAVEYVFLFSKSQDYFYDRYAVMMPSSDTTHPRVGRDGSFKANRITDETLRGVNPKALASEHGTKQNSSFTAGCSQYVVGTRNRRNSDWLIESWQGMLTDENGDPIALVVNPKGTSIQHFASYPEKLVEPMIKASTSEGGCCAVCGAPWRRLVKDGEPDLAHQKACGGDSLGLYSGRSTKDYKGNYVQDASDVKRRILAGMRAKITSRWESECGCQTSDTVPAIVLDPFSGISTTGMVASALGRRSILCELNPQYHEASKVRDSQGAMALL